LFSEPDVDDSVMGSNTNLESRRDSERIREEVKENEIRDFKELKEEDLPERTSPIKAFDESNQMSAEPFDSKESYKGDHNSSDKSDSGEVMKKKFPKLKPLPGIKKQDPKM